MFKASCLIVILILSADVHGHGRMEEPPARNAAWRYGFGVPANYDDVGLNCGGLSVQKSNEGKCGVCGDAYNGPRDHETGGKYATNTLVRHYLEGALIDIKILLSANHKGFMEFRLCPASNPFLEVTQECLDANLLSIEGYGTQYPVNEATDLIFLRLQLPANLSCTRCVLQWKYHAGNNWGRDVETGLPCLGCGLQEEFYNCADISIASSNMQLLPPTSTIAPRFLYLPFDYPVISRPSTVTTISLPIIDMRAESVDKTLHCYPTNESLKPLLGIERWCLQLCAISCPPTLCACVYM